MRGRQDGRQGDAGGDAGGDSPGAGPADADGAALLDGAADVLGLLDAADVPPTSPDAPHAPDALEPLSECPDEPPFDAEPCVKGLGCSYGKECCCGECEVSVSCTCHSGKMACGFSDFCLGRFCSDGCPDQQIATQPPGAIRPR
ncbi:MAG: hypothetical protein AMXMBFR64_62920 [Myxococcales bacterium]